MTVLRIFVLMALLAIMVHSVLDARRRERPLPWQFWMLAALALSSAARVFFPQNAAVETAAVISILLMMYAAWVGLRPSPADAEVKEKR